jgi:hypothetical protein
MVEVETAAEHPRALDKRQQPRGCFLDLFVAGQLGIRTPDNDPNLRMQLEFPEVPEGLVTHAPEGKVFQPTFLVFEYLLLKLRHMRLPPIRRDFGEAQFLEQLGAFSQTAFHRVERHDAPATMFLRSSSGVDSAAVSLT